MKTKILLRDKICGTQNYKLKWEEDKGYFVTENGYLVNHYGKIDRNKALKRFSSKIYRIKNPKWKNYLNN